MRRITLWNRWVCTALMVIGACTHAFSAGIAKIEVPAYEQEALLKGMVWSPCTRSSALISMGPFQVEGTPNCPIEGNALPLVIISHGKGASMLSHHDTARALADAGFVVVTFNHTGDSFGDETASLDLKIFESRVRDVSRIVSFMTEQWQGREHLDRKAIGVFGFSRGGYTALALAGATPHLISGANRVCIGEEATKNILCHQFNDTTLTLSPTPDSRIRAIVVVDPLNLFHAQGLHSITIPLQLWASEYGGDGVLLSHSEEIKDALNVSTFYVAKGAGHFAFLAPCPSALAKELPELCKDPQGFDRVGWHDKMNRAVVDFFRQHLFH